MAVNTILVTGAMGFVGTHLRAALRATFPRARIVGTGLHACEDILALDITARDTVYELIASVQPDVCVHLAGIAAIGAARANPGQAWAINLHGTLNIADAIMAGAPHCRLIFVSSAECYGASFKSGHALDESAPLAPMNLYAATKAAADLALGARAAEGLRLLRLRPFNHTGPGQTEDFVVPAFAGQIARIEAGLMPPEIAVGALEPERDFLDIRDICAAYTRCVECDEDLPPNEIFNLASGQAMKIGTILNMLLARAKCPITIRTDPARLRPVEIPRAIGDAAYAANMLGWTPKFQLEETLDTVLGFARRKTMGG
jgi:GDP-4-dehydro-6-deoxy-D-mannose reductase